MHLRPLVEGDRALLEEAIRLNVNWDGEERFAAADPGCGYVADGVPELSLCV